MEQQQQQQLNINFEIDFCKYDAENPHIYSKFKDMTIKTIGRGFKNYTILREIFQVYIPMLLY